MIPQKNPPLGVVILGAGASSRMGRPKLLLPWGKTSVIGHIIEQWKMLGAVQVAVVLRPTDAAMNTELDRVGFSPKNRIQNPHPERGMFSSILCAANWDGWHERLKVWAVALGDQPHLRMDTLQALLAFQTGHPDAICQPVYDGHTRHPVLLPRRAFDELKNSRAETLKGFLGQTCCRLSEFFVQDSGLALDLDSPEDYEKMFEMHRGNV